MNQPPRAASVAAIDAGELTWEEAKRIEVSLDGEVQTKVTAYDCDAGFVERNATDSEGKIIVENDDVKSERLTGEVTVAWKDAR